MCTRNTEFSEDFIKYILQFSVSKKPLTELDLANDSYRIPALLFCYISEKYGVDSPRQNRTSAVVEIKTRQDFLHPETYEFFEIRLVAREVWLRYWLVIGMSFEKYAKDYRYGYKFEINLVNGRLGLEVNKITGDLLIPESHAYVKASLGLITELLDKTTEFLKSVQT